MEIRKHLFHGWDYAFCDFAECEKKSTCKRYIGHYNFSDNSMVTYVLILDSKDCKSYVEVFHE